MLNFLFNFLFYFLFYFHFYFLFYFHFYFYFFSIINYRLRERVLSPMWWTFFMISAGLFCCCFSRAAGSHWYSAIEMTI